MTTKPNEPINPTVFTEVDHHDGLTKREYFAAIAMQGMIAQTQQQMPLDKVLEIPENVASWAVSFADALITELNKEK